MSTSANLERAIEIVQKAIDYDTKHNYPEALKYYVNALDYFMLAHKWERNDKSKQLIKTKITEYLDRAETLKKYIASQDKGRNANGSGGATGPTGKKEDVEDDPETKKLRAGLAGAVLTETPNVK